MSIRVTLNCPLIPERVEELKGFLAENLPNVRSFEGNKRVSVLFASDNKEMLLDEVWLSVEQHKSYLRFIESNGVLSQLASYLKSPPEIKYFQSSEL
ncbi:antibiotic biosynthesis monooxygenase [Vibrio sp. RE88]|uniref:putative quinol monooxygenase n=1 Tax=Vibrio sp. RE88 TaxID=2607610 RepID=UPI0014938143|nr:antibiotic biosynthesis monooxygenase [Vibrio sp. RE88]NOH63516.1 antibiotic biosynthesis monooxygenase [Vibrio sp. RE88]